MAESRAEYYMTQVSDREGPVKPPPGTGWEPVMMTGADRGKDTMSSSIQRVNSILWRRWFLEGRDS